MFKQLDSFVSAHLHKAVFIGGIANMLTMGLKHSAREFWRLSTVQGYVTEPAKVAVMHFLREKKQVWYD